MDVVGPISNSNSYPSSHTGPLDAPVEIPGLIPTISEVRSSDRKPLTAFERTKQLFQKGRNLIDGGTLPDQSDVVSAIESSVLSYLGGSDFDDDAPYNFDFLLAKTVRLYAELGLLASNRSFSDRSGIYDDSTLARTVRLVRYAKSRMFNKEIGAPEVEFELRCAKQACKRWRLHSGGLSESYLKLAQILEAPRPPKSPDDSVLAQLRAVATSDASELLKAIRGSSKSHWYDHVLGIQLLGGRAASDHNYFVIIHDFIGTIYRGRYLVKRVEILLGIVDTLADAAWNGDETVQLLAISGWRGNPGLAQLASVSRFPNNRNKHLWKVRDLAVTYLTSLKRSHSRTVINQLALEALESLDDPSAARLWSCGVLPRFLAWRAAAPLRLPRLDTLDDVPSLDAYQGSFFHSNDSDSSYFDDLVMWGKVSKVTKKEYRQLIEFCKVTPNLRPIEILPVLNHFGELLSKQGEKDRALRCFKRALAFADADNSTDALDVASIARYRVAALRHLGWIDQRTGAFKRAVTATAYLSNKPADVTACLQGLDLGLQLQGVLDQAITNSQRAELMNRVMFSSEGLKLPNRRGLTAARSMLKRIETTITGCVQTLDEEKHCLGEHRADVKKQLIGFGGTLEKKNIRRALSFYRKTLPVFKVIHSSGAAYTDLLIKMGALARTLGQQENSVYYCEQALQIDEEQQGKTHPLIARDLNNLGLSYQARGNIVKAINCYEKALDICEQRRAVSEESRPSILDNLGNAQSMAGNHEKAIDYHKQALALDEGRNDGRDLGKVAIRLNNLGESYRRQKMPEEAIGCYERALETFKESYGPSDPNVATAYNNLGLASQDLGKIVAAINFGEAALEIDRVAYGTLHPNVGRDAYNLGRSLKRFGECKEAIQHYIEALVVMQALFRDDHPDIASIKNSLGIALNAEGRREEALRYLEEAVEMSGRLKDRERSNTTSFAYNLYRQNLAKVNGSKESLATSREIYDPHKLRIMESLESQGEAFLKLKHFEEALDAYRRASEMRSELGLPSLRQGYEKMVQALIALERMRDANVLFLRELRPIEDRTIVGLTPDLDRARWCHYLFNLYKDLGDGREAAWQGRAALALYSRMEGGYEQETQQLNADLAEIERRASNAN